MTKFVKGPAMRPLLLGLTFGLGIATAPVTAQTQGGALSGRGVDTAQTAPGQQDAAPQGERPELMLTAASGMPPVGADAEPRVVVGRKRFSLPWQTGVFQ